MVDDIIDERQEEQEKILKIHELQEMIKEAEKERKDFERKKYWNYEKSKDVKEERLAFTQRSCMARKRN